MRQQIYADNAATTQMDNDAYEEMLKWLSEEYGNASQPYIFAREPKKVLQTSRETIASCIGALPDEIFFTSGGTESDNWAIKGTAFQNNKRRSIITSAFEHHAVLHSCEAIERLGCSVAHMWPDRNGYISTETLERYITDETLLVSVMYANNEIGSIQPIKELCTIAHTHGALFHTDAVQGVGHVEIDVNNLDIDMLSASAHKFNGPKGAGFLYIRTGTCISPLLDGGAQEKKLRAGTENVAGIAAMAVALKKNCEHMKQNRDHILSMEDRLLTGLRTKGIQFQRNGEGNTLPGLISLSFSGFEGEAILHRMDLMGICISTGSACNSARTEISHVLKAIKLRDELSLGTIRISLGKNNTDDDVDRIVAGLAKILI